MSELLKCEVCGRRRARYVIYREDYPKLYINVCGYCRDNCTFEFITFPLLQIIKGGKNG
jgi:hypothetical protein